MQPESAAREADRREGVRATTGPARDVDEAKVILRNFGTPGRDHRVIAPLVPARIPQ